MKTTSASLSSRLKLSWRLSRRPLTGALLALTAFGCSGTTAFKDTTPIQIAVVNEPPPPPPPPADVPPDEPPPPQAVSLSNTIQFSYDGARVLANTFETLQEVVQVLKSNPDVKKVRVAGYASEEGTEQHNQQLSTARARAVRAYLIARGVSARRLTAKGYGESDPVASNDTEDGREQNRRVQFEILEQDNN